MKHLLRYKFLLVPALASVRILNLGPTDRRAKYGIFTVQLVGPQTRGEHLFSRSQQNHVGLPEVIGLKLHNYGHNSSRICQLQAELCLIFSSDDELNMSAR